MNQTIFNNSIFKSVAFISLLLTLPVSSICQENFADPLTQLTLNTKLISEHKIKSLVIYADFSEDDIEDESNPYMMSGKVKEIEFDETGNIVYQIFADENGYEPFVTYGRGSYFEYSSYDDTQKLIYFYTENRLMIRSESRIYDAKGNHIASEFGDGSKLLFRQEYTWSDGKMIDSKVSASADSTNMPVTSYDDLGRPTKYVSNNLTLTFTRLDYTDSSQTVIQTYRSDKLASTQTFIFLKSNGKILHSILKNPEGELMTEKKARFDEKGNITYYYLNDLTRRYHGDQKYPASTLEIKNFYDYRGLLVKRLFYSSREDVGSKILIKIERFVYDSDTLPLKLKPGSLKYSETTEDSYEIEPEQEKE
jgi:hypothetical protein